MNRGVRGERGERREREGGEREETQGAGPRAWACSVGVEWTTWAGAQGGSHSWARKAARQASASHRRPGPSPRAGDTRRPEVSPLCSPLSPPTRPCNSTPLFSSALFPPPHPPPLYPPWLARSRRPASPRAARPPASSWPPRPRASPRPPPVRFFRGELKKKAGAERLPRPPAGHLARRAPARAPHACAGRPLLACMRE